MNIEELKKIVRGNGFQESHGSTTMVIDVETVVDLLDELKQCDIPVVVRSKTLESKIANKRERIKGDLQNAKNIINGNKGMSSDYIIDKTRNMPFLRCKLNLIDELLDS